MSQFYINGEKYCIEGSRRLIDLLREELRLTSVKNGCAEGACGACTVLVDGEAKRSCVLKTDKLEGAHIVTVEGLSEREKEVFAFAFTEAGAVQCGYCTPGMVMSAKALIDKCPAPTIAEIKRAIRPNLCRCTGYKKIEEAILLAARLLLSGEAVPKREFTGLTGESMARSDAAQKTIGETLYAGDIYMEGMLYAAVRRSDHPRARVISIDTAEAESLPGVVKIATEKDVPGNKKIGHIKKDWDVLIPVGGITHYVGDALAVVAASDEQTARAAAALIKIEYEVLEPVTSPAMAMTGDIRVHREGNLLARERLVRGDAEASIAKSAYSVTRHYSLPFTEHAFLEPESAAAFPEKGRIHIISGDQGIYQTRRECAELLGVPESEVRVTAAAVGGGFGGKEDMSVQHHAALMAWLTGRPVRLTLTRQESIAVHPKRHAMEIDMTTSCDERGMLTGMKAVIISDTGAYASLGGPVLQRACTHAAGPYNFHDIDITGEAYYTNNPPAGAFRGFGVTQSCFAMECNLDLLAEKAGISPFEIRYRNAVRPGDILPNGQLADETTALIETLEAVREDYEKDPSSGIACAIKNSGLGVGIPDSGRCRIEVREGKLHVYSSAACIGQGMGTVQRQMVCETAGVSPELVIWEAPDTDLAPNAGNTTASRQTLFTGEAACRAAQKLKEAAEKAGSLDALEGESFMGEYTGITDKMGAEKQNPVSHIAYGYATHLVQLDNAGNISRVIAAHDVGRAVNPRMAEGQIEGGVVMSLGYALTERFPLKNCRPAARFGTLGLFRADKTPEIVSRLTGKSLPGLALGAKGIGEICSIPTPAAVALAYYHKDGIFRTALPLSGTVYER